MNKNIIIGLLVIVIVISGGYSIFSNENSNTGGPAYWEDVSFLQGMNAGTRDQFSVSNAGVLTTSGIANLTETLNVTEATGTSTISVQATAGSTGGRIILEDSDGAGCSEIYILNGTIISAGITCP